MKNPVTKERKVMRGGKKVGENLNSVFKSKIKTKEKGCIIVEITE